MDPADTDDAAASLAARVVGLTLEVRRQGALGEEHSRNLREVSASLSRFATALSSLESRLTFSTPPAAHDSETSAADHDTFRESPSLPEPEPMHLGRAHLTAEERDQRLRSGSCMYCGRMGHIRLHCPLRPGNGPAWS
ncbi:unnamed protein product [Boreogadus saida]